MEQLITAFMNRHQLVQPERTVIVGVSGGPDSMALLHFLCSIRADWKLKLIAVSVDHQLRGEESKRDLHYVEKVCEKWNIKFEGTAVNVASYKKKKQLGTQVAARELRYQFFREQMEKHHADYIALGHHGDDQVETMLMNLVRSSNPKALSGIPAKRPFASGFIIRPLLCVTKEEIEHYCEVHELFPRRDPSNEETVYTRNYFRKNIMPQVLGINSNLHTSVQRLSETLQADEHYLQQQAEAMVEKVVTFEQETKQASFTIDLFQSYPHALQRRAYHLILNYLYEELPKNLAYVHEEHFFALLVNNEGNRQLDFPRHLKLRKTYQTLTFCFPNENSHHLPFYKVIHVPGETMLPNGSKLIATYTENPDGHGEETYFCNVANVSLPLHIRSRTAGDRMHWKGLGGSKKVKDIFIDAKIPLHDRDNWPIITDNNGKILWLIGLKKGQPEALEKNGSYIQLYYEDSNT